MKLFEFISGIFKPAAKLIDDVHTSTEEKHKLRNALVELENNILSEAIEYETRLLDAKSSIIVAEADGQSWIQRSWRPITMLTFLVLVVLDSFGLLSNRLSPEAWTLLTIGIGGYVAGRSAEKFAKTIKQK